MEKKKKRQTLIVQLSREENPGGGQLSAGQTETREAEGVALGGQLRDAVSEAGAAAALPLSPSPPPHPRSGRGSRLESPRSVAPAF